MQESGQLNFIKRPGRRFFRKIRIDFGIFLLMHHTEKKMMIVLSQYQDKTTSFFCADLIPTA
jgi:hypothetical protein